MKALILWTRLSGYFLHCIENWQRESGVELHIVRKGVDSQQAPFMLDLSGEGIRYYDREAMSNGQVQALADAINPDLIICAGWADSAYLNVVKGARHRAFSVLTMDNQWLGTWRQIIGQFWGRLRLPRLFDSVWVPGDRQSRFATKLGFSSDQIEHGLYVADAGIFDRIRESHSGAPSKRLIFLGRYVSVKGIKQLWEGFIEFHNNTNSDLELWCIGAGPLDDAKPEHPKIRHCGFVQPQDLPSFIEGGGVFVLPSLFEPWGVVVQEFALAGCPLILSKHVGAGDCLLDETNGYLLPEVSPSAIVDAAQWVDALTEKEMMEMSAASTREGRLITTQSWVDQANRFLAAGIRKKQKSAGNEGRNS